MKITVNQKGAEALKLLLDSYLKAHWLNWKNDVDLIIDAINVADQSLLAWDKDVEKYEAGDKDNDTEDKDNDASNEWTKEDKWESFEQM